MRTLQWIGPRSNFSDPVWHFLQSLPSIKVESYPQLNFHNFDYLFSKKGVNGLAFPTQDSKQEAPLKDYFNLTEKNEILDSIESRPELFISEDFESLTQLSFQFPNTFQIYLCSETNLWSTLSSNVRPLNRFFFIISKQTLSEFQELFERISKIKQTPSQIKVTVEKNSREALNAMKNSLGVLSKINQTQLHELTLFSQKEEERRKNFHSLIQLARSFSMSRDIEEVIQALWNNLRTIQNIKGLSFLIKNKNQSYQQIVNRNGKFHFERLSLTHTLHQNFLKYLFQSTEEREGFHLGEQHLEALQVLQNKTLQNIHCFPVIERGSENPFFLFIEFFEKITSNELIVNTLRDRFSFIKLTLEKHLLQEEIKSRVNLWASTFDDLKDPLAIVKNEKNIIRANQSFLSTIYNGESSELKSDPNFDQNKDFNLFNELKLNNIKSFSSEIQLRNKIYRYQNFPIRDSDNSLPRAHILYFIDITSERLLYNQLLQSEKMVGISKLAGNLTQTLTSPLNTILELVEKGSLIKNLSDQILYDLNEIKKASLRSLKIIYDFTNFTHGKIEKAKIDAETIIETTIPLIKSLIHGHRFQLLLSNSRHSIFVSFSLIQQVLYNLLRNAHQSLQGSGTIKITTESYSIKEIAGVKISVVDSGGGVPEELRPKLFHPLVSTKGQGGTGLGLHFVKQIVENHNGIVGYEPLEEKGSNFWIWFPLF